MADTKISALPAATTPLDGTEVLPIVQSSTTKKVTNNDLRPKQIQSNATSGVLQIVGPAAASTRVMTTPNANFTAARTDAGQTFTGDQTISGKLGVNTTADEYLTVGGAIRAQSNALNWNSSAGALMDYYSGSARCVVSNGSTAGYFTLDTSSNITAYGNLIQGTAAKGINFTANTGATGKTSQLLNWYEEGTWTPTITANSGTFTTVSSIAGIYTRIGRQVTIQGSFTMTTKGTGSLALVSGLPFNPDGTNRYQGCFTDVSSGYAGIVYGRPTNSFYLYKYDGTDGLVDGHQYAFEVTYFT